MFSSAARAGLLHANTRAQLTSAAHGTEERAFGATRSDLSDFFCRDEQRDAQKAARAEDCLVDGCDDTVGVTGKAGLCGKHYGMLENARKHLRCAPQPRPALPSAYALYAATRR